MNLGLEQDSLFEDWRERLPNIVTDGVFNSDEYSKSAIKTLFVLKEPHSKNRTDSWSLLDVVRDGHIKKTWSSIAIWSEMINDLAEGAHSDSLKWSDYNLKKSEFIAKALKRVAVMNLKKTAGETSTDMKVLKEVLGGYDDYSDFFKRQFELYNPDIIICCGEGVADVFLSLLNIKHVHSDWKSTRRDIWYFDSLTNKSDEQKRPLVSWLHPQLRGRMRDSMAAFSLSDAVAELEPWKVRK